MRSPQSMSVDNFFDRTDPEKKFILQQIEKAEDPKKTMRNFRECLAQINSQENYQAWLDSGFFTLIRNDIEKDTRAENLDILANHFNLN